MLNLSLTVRLPVPGQARESRITLTYRPVEGANPQINDMLAQGK